MYEFRYNTFLKSDSCRDSLELKDAAYCFASKQIKKMNRELPLTFTEEALPKYLDWNYKDTIYYVETQKKTGRMNEYTQFLFAKLPDDPIEYKKLYKNDPEVKIKVNPFLFTLKT